jgi:hypothetical protein
MPGFSSATAGTRLPQIFRRGAGYYLNVGASELIIRADIKLRSRVEIEATKERSLQLSDGSELAAHVIIYATGYDRGLVNPAREHRGNGWQNQRLLRLRRAWRPGTGTCGTCGSPRLVGRHCDMAVDRAA